MDKLINGKGKMNNNFNIVRYINNYINNAGSIFKLLILLILIIVVMSILRPGLFLKKDNFISMAFQFPEYGLMAIGVMLTMVTGGIDLSTVGIATFSATTAAILMKALAPAGAPNGQVDFSIIVSVLLSLVIGALCGLFNAFLISKIKIPAMLTTMGTMQFFSGISLVMSSAKTVTGIPYKFSEIGTSLLFDFIPLPAIIFIIAAVIVGFILSKTTFGLRVFMLGTNPNASVFAGQNNASILYRVYMISGILVSMAGLIMMARMNSIRSDFGVSYTMLSVLIVILGGTNPVGGYGTVTGVVMAVLILQCFSSGLNMFTDLSSYIRDFAWGLTLVIVMIINCLTQKKDRRRA